METEKENGVVRIFKYLNNPFVLAIISIVLLYIINLTPLVFFIAALVWYLSKKSIIGVKDLLFYITTFSFTQLIINTILFLVTGMFVIVGYQYAIFRLVGFFILSFLYGSIIFYLSNLIFSFLGKIINKLSK